jgi:hypothetical protein
MSRPSPCARTHISTCRNDAIQDGQQGGEGPSGRRCSHPRLLAALVGGDAGPETPASAKGRALTSHGCCECCRRSPSHCAVTGCRRRHGRQRRQLVLRLGFEVLLSTARYSPSNRGGRREEGGGTVSSSPPPPCRPRRFRRPHR